MFFVYLLESTKYNQAYIGSTNDLQRRLREHNGGLEISTRRYMPWRIVAYEAYRSDKDAREREKKLKGHGNAAREFKKRAQNSFKNSAGFTLLELLLSIVLIAALFSITVPIFQFFQTRNDLDTAANTVVQAFRRAQIISQAADGNVEWGVKIQPGSVTIFKGGTYGGREQAYDELYEMASVIMPSGVTEIAFEKFTGIPSVSGTITLTSANSETRIISINSKGTVDY